MDSSKSAVVKSTVLTLLLALLALLFTNGPAQAAFIEGNFDTSEGMNVISGDFVSNTLSPGTEPAIDAQLRSVLESGGYQFDPLGISITGIASGCKNGSFFGNLYLVSDPRLTAFWGVDAIILIPAGMICGIGAGVTPFGAGEAILIVYIGSQIPNGYFGSADVLMVSGSSVAISEGLNGMFLRLGQVQ